MIFTNAVFFAVRVYTIIAGAVGNSLICNPWDAFIVSYFTKTTPSTSGATRQFSSILEINLKNQINYGQNKSKPRNNIGHIKSFLLLLRNKFNTFCLCGQGKFLSGCCKLATAWQNAGGRSVLAFLRQFQKQGVLL